MPVQGARGRGCCKLKTFFKSNSFRFIIALIAVIIAALVITMIPTLHTDMTHNKLMTLTNEFSARLKALDTDVEAYLIAENTDSNNNLWIDEVLTKADQLSDRFTYSLVDSGSTKLGAVNALANGKSLMEGNVVVSANGRSLVLDDSYLAAIEFDENYYYYYGTYMYTRADFTLQSAMCNVIDYLLNDDLPAIHVFTGHGENGMDGKLYDVAYQNNFIVKETSELTDDVKVLLVCNPAAPLTDAEKASVSDFLKNGGKLMFMSSYTTEMGGWDEILADYGMKMLPGTLFESSAKYYYSADYPYVTKPVMRSDAYTDALIEANASVILPIASPLARSDVRRAGLNTSILFTTSDTAYHKSDLAHTATASQEENDETGTFVSGMVAREGDTVVLWVPSSMFITESSELMANGGNSAFLSAVLSDMAALSPVERTVTGQSLLSDYVQIPAATAYIALFSLPLICLILGFLFVQLKKPRKKAA